jgi:PKD repeat protein
MNRKTRKHEFKIAVVLFLLLIALGEPALAGNAVTITGEILPADPLIADFSATPVSGSAPLAVQFSDESAGAVTAWAWDFQNDGIVDSAEQNPGFIYDAAGTYTVKLTVNGPGGSDTCEKQGFITVTKKAKKPIARFAQDRHVGSAPLTVAFTDRSLNSPTEYFWSFGDGTTSSEKDPVHTFSRAGIYHITLRVSNDAGSDIARGVTVALYRWRGKEINLPSLFMHA